MSAIWRRPPGLRMRNISPNTSDLSGERLAEPFEMTMARPAIRHRQRLRIALPDLEVAGCASAIPRRAFSSIASVISTPITWPEGPTALAAMCPSRPAPEPTSTTYSPSLGVPSQTSSRCRRTTRSRPPDAVEPLVPVAVCGEGRSPEVEVVAAIGVCATSVYSRTICLGGFAPPRCRPRSASGCAATVPEHAAR